MQVCRLTGGQLYKYTYFQPDLDGERFLADLKHNLSRPIVFDAIMRVRTSTGVRPVEFFGSFYMANTTDTELAAINSDMAVACKFELHCFLSFLSHFNMKLLTKVCAKGGAPHSRFWQIRRRRRQRRRAALLRAPPDF